MRATWRAGTTAGASRWMPRSGSKAPTAAAWSACYATARGRPWHWSDCNRSLTTNSSIASPGLEPDGRTELRLTPLELIERLAALIPPPRLHRHRCHGVLWHPILRSARRSLPWHGRQPRPRRHRCRLAIPPSTPSARPRASSGRCCWRASTRSCPCAAPLAKQVHRLTDAFLVGDRHVTCPGSQLSFSAGRRPAIRPGSSSFTDCHSTSRSTSKYA